jgi:hypothetical protein
MQRVNFDRSVFINCPFDNEYRSKLQALIFTIRYCDFFPRIASERFNSSEIRMDKILEIILECKYSIHDFSRIQATQAGDYARFNMPLELGLDLGCKYFHTNKKYREKQTLILENDKGSVHRAMSDLGGSDMRCYEGDTERLVEGVRNWLADHSAEELPGPSLVWDDFNIFNADLYQHFRKKGFKAKNILSMPFSEYLRFLDDWLPERT